MSFDPSQEFEEFNPDENFEEVSSDTSFDPNQDFEEFNPEADFEEVAPQTKGLFSSPNSTPEAIKQQSIFDRRREKEAERLSQIETPSVPVGDYGRNTMTGFANLYDDAGYLVNKLGAEDYGNAMRATAKDALKYWNDGKSTEAEAVEAEKFISRTEQGDIDYPQTIANIVTNPEKVGLSVANSVGGTLAGMSVGGLLAKGFSLIPKIGETVASMMGYGLGEGSMASVEGAKETEEKILKMPISQMKNHPEFKSALIATKGDEEEARKLLAEAAAGDAAALIMLATTITSAPAGAIFSNLLIKDKAIAETPLKSLLLGALGEFSQEFTQSGAETASQNQAVKRRVDQSQDIMEGVPESMIEGGLSGLVMGGGTGVASSAYDQTPTAKKNVANQEIANVIDSYDFVNKPDAGEDVRNAEVDGRNNYSQRLLNQKNWIKQQIQQITQMPEDEKEKTKKELIAIIDQSTPEERGQALTVITDTLESLEPEVAVEVAGLLENNIDPKDVKQIEEVIAKKDQEQVPETALSESEAYELQKLEEAEISGEISDDDVWRMEDLQMKRDGVTENPTEQTEPAQNKQEAPEPKQEVKEEKKPVKEGNRADDVNLYEDITQHPLFETVIENSKDLYAKDTGERKGGGSSSYMDPQTGLVQRVGVKGSPNMNRGANLTKGDILTLEKKGMTPEIEEKIRQEIARYQNDPLLEEHLVKPKSKIAKMIETNRALGERGQKTKSIKPAENKIFTPKPKEQSKISSMIEGTRLFGAEKTKTKSIKPAESKLTKQNFKDKYSDEFGYFRNNFIQEINTEYQKEIKDIQKRLDSGEKLRDGRTKEEAIEYMKRKRDSIIREYRMDTKTAVQNGWAGDKKVMTASEKEKLKNKYKYDIDTDNNIMNEEDANQISELGNDETTQKEKETIENLKSVYGRVTKESKKAKILETIKEKEKKLEEKTKPAKNKELGVNTRGNKIVEDERGVRHYIESGVMVGEAVGIRPDGGIEIPADAETRYKKGGKEYLTVEEIAEIEGDNKSKYALSDYDAVYEAMPTEQQPKAGTQSTLFGQGQLLDTTGGMEYNVPKWAKKLVTDTTRYEDLLQAITGARTGNITPLADRIVDLYYKANKKTEATNGGLLNETDTTTETRPDENVSPTSKGTKPNNEPREEKEPSDRGSDGSGDNDRSTTTNRPASDVSDEGSSNAGSNPKSKLKNQFTISQNEAITKGEVSRFNDNFKAIKLLKENKTFYTKEELNQLSKYTGWGGIQKAFPNISGEYEAGWKDRGNALKELLTEEEYNTAKGSILDAFYTPPEIINTMWNISEHLGFDGGSVLEPSVGTGRFIGMTPQNIKNISFDGIELDSTTSKIASILYPRSNIRNIGFEKTNHLESFEMVIGNPPYGNFSVYDPENKNLNKLSIHNYFMVKSLKALKQGGVVNFVITSSFMENINKTTATLINQHAKLIGAIRLPNNVFKASGTEVTTDIVIFQKLKDGETGNMDEWFGKVKQPNGLNINKYFNDNPEMMLGEWVKAYRGNALKGNPETFEAELAEAIKDLPANIMPSFQGTVRAEIQSETDKTIAPSIIYEKNGKHYVNVKLNEDTEAVVVSSKVAKAYIPLRDSLKSVIDLQNEKNVDDKKLDTARKDLNKKYDSFVKTNGLLNKASNRSVIVNDNYGYTVLSLEQEEKKAPIFSKRTASPEKEIRTEDTKEALTITLNRKGGVDMDYLQEVTGKTEDQILKDLKGEIFFDVTENKYVPKEVYLSGDVKTKLEKAEDQLAIDELLKVIPEDLQAKDIPVQMGASWISPKIMMEYAVSELGFNPRTLNILFDSVSGKWTVEGYSSSNPFEIPYYNNKDILEKALNQKKIIVRKKIDGKSYIDEEATAYSNQKLEDLKDHFGNWIFSDGKRTSKLVPHYNDLFNRSVVPNIDKSAESYEIPNLREPTFDKNGKKTGDGFVPRKHQRNAVYRAVYGDSPLLLNHPVGSGKTLTAQMIAMEWKRLGVANKPVIATLKSVVPQFAKEFKEAFPNANLLVPTEKDFSKANRRKLLSAIATGDYDAIIITHDNLKELQNPEETVKEVLEERLVELNDSLENSSPRSKSDIQKKIKKIEQDYEDITNTAKNRDVLSFDQLGIDGIIVDESHKFKKIGFSSSLDIKGIDTQESQMGVDLLIKTRHILKSSNNVIFMTGTPITNTLPELYAIQKTLQPDLLKKQGIYAFDSWANQYSVTETDVEVTGTGKFKEVTRIKQYTNLDALYQSVGQVIDTVTNKEVIANDPNFKLPPIKGGEAEQVVLPASELQEDYILELDERLKTVNEKDNPDNYLAIFGDASRMSLDIRFVVDGAKDNLNSKANQAVNRAYDIYNKFEKEKGTQLIFTDLGIPNSQGRFDLYNDIKNKLIAKGVPAEEVALIGEYDSSAKKKQLSDKVNNGEIRFVIGSTQKLGTGMNLQKKLVAVHHLDIPYTPAELEQRNGRIIRQGNEILAKDPNFEIQIFNYATEKTLDGTRWQILKNKLEFIQQFQEGNTDMDLDIDEGSQKEQAEKMIALASGNPLLLDRVKAEKKLKKLRSLKRGYNTARSDNLNALDNFKNNLEKGDSKLENLNKDMEQAGSPIMINNKTFKKTKDLGQAVLDEISKYKSARGTRGKVIGNVGDLEIKIDYNYGSNTAKIQLIGNTTNSITIDFISQGDVGMGTKIENLSSKDTYKKAIDITNNNIETAKARIPTLEKALEEKFAQQDDLEATEKELQDLNDQMQEEATPSQPKDEEEEGMRPAFIRLQDVLSSPSRGINLVKNILDEAVYDHLTSKIEDTKVDNFIRKRLGGSMSGLGMMPRKQEQQFTKLYRMMRADIANGEMSAEKASDLIKEHFGDIDTTLFQDIMGIEAEGLMEDPDSNAVDQINEAMFKKMYDAVVIRYLENPDSRDDIANHFPDLANELDSVREYIDDISKEAMARGILLPSQYKRWEGKYLSRLYLIQNSKLDQATANAQAGIKMGKIKSGRKIESIVDFVAEFPEKAQELGVVLDPELMVKMTISKTTANIALEDFFRSVAYNTDILKAEHTISLSEPIAELPTTFSPYYAEKTIIPYISDMISNLEKEVENGDYGEIAEEQFRTHIELLKEEIARIRDEISATKQVIGDYDTKKYAKIPEDVRYGAIAGLPISKDLASLVKSQFYIVKDPEMFAEKIDKAGSQYLTYFKWAKVPANVFSYSRNLASNQFQWAMSGADPVTFLPEWIRGLKSYLTKDEWYNRARSQGLIDDNQMTFEVNNELKKMMEDLDVQGRGKGFKRKVLKVMQKFGDIYGSIDDIAKIARMRYAVDTEGKSDFDGASIAQDTHYDYGLTYDLVRAIRDPNITKATVGKLLFTLFPTYTQKTIAFLYESLLKRPATMALMSAGLMALMNLDTDDDEAEKEMGKEEWERLQKSIPQWIKDNPFARVSYEKGRSGDWNVYITDVGNVVPFGSIASGGFMLARGNIFEGLSKLGAGGSPFQIVGDFVNNKDSFTGRDIYYKYDDWQKTKDITAHLAKQLSPATFNRLLSLSETRHPVVPRIFGLNTYLYSPEDMKRSQEFKATGAKRDAGRRASKYKSIIRRAKRDLDKGDIGVDKYLEIKAKNDKEIQYWKELGQDTYKEITPKANAEVDFKEEIKFAKNKTKELKDLLRRASRSPEDKELFVKTREGVNLKALRDMESVRKLTERSVRKHKSNIAKVSNLKMSEGKRNQIIRNLNKKIDSDYTKGLKIYRTIQRKYKKN